MRGLHHQTKIGSRRDAVTLLHRIVRCHAFLERFECGLVLAVKRDLHDGAQAVTRHRTQLVNAEHCNLALDQTGIAQAFDTAQTSRRRNVKAASQCLVADRRVVLEVLQQLDVDGVNGYLFHVFMIFGINRPF